jgi:kynurenine formamidase
VIPRSAGSRATGRIGTEQVRAAGSLIRAGRIYDLGLDLNASVPQGDAAAFTPFSFSWRHRPDSDAAVGEFQFAAETLTGTPHIGTHIDGLMHAMSGCRTFGGSEFREVAGDQGFLRDGMETVPPIITRAIALDIAGLHSVPALPDGYEVTQADLDGALLSQSVSIAPGDAVLVRTGKIREYGTNNDAYQRAQPGVGRPAAIWLYEQGMAILGTDTAGTEPLPFADSTLTTHQAMLVERGVHLVENLNLDELAADKVSEGMFVCLPLRITGGTGSWVRPVVII